MCYLFVVLSLRICTCSINKSLCCQSVCICFLQYRTPKNIIKLAVCCCQYVWQVITAVTIKFKFIIIHLSCIKETHVNLFPTSCTSSYVRVICACFCRDTSPSSNSMLPTGHVNLKYNIIFGKW